MVECRNDLLEVDGSVRGKLAESVRGADGLSGAHAAGQYCAAHLRPVIAPCAGVDLRRTAELASRDDRHVVQHAAHVEVFDQRAYRLVELRAMIPYEVEVATVAVPGVKGQCDALHARFNESACQEQWLVGRWCSIDFCRACRLRSTRARVNLPRKDRGP